MLLTLSPRHSIFLHSHPPFLSTSGRRCPPPPLRACPLPTAGSLSPHTPRCGTFWVGNGIGNPPTHNPSSAQLPHAGRVLNTGFGTSPARCFPCPLASPRCPLHCPHVPCAIPMPCGHRGRTECHATGCPALHQCPPGLWDYGLVPSLAPQASTEDTGDTCRRRLVPLGASCLARPRHWRGRGRRLRPRGLSVRGCCPPTPAPGTRLEPGASSLQPRGGPRASTWGCLTGTVP